MPIAPTSAQAPRTWAAAPEAASPSLRVVRRILQFVCLADMGLGALILLVPQLLFRLFGTPQPEDLLWFQLIGMMLIPTAIDGFIGFSNTERYPANVVVSAGSRLATAGFLLTVSSVRSVPTILIVLGVGEALVGVLTVYYWMRTRPPTSALPAHA